MNVEGVDSGYLVLRNEADLWSFRIVARAMLMEQVQVEDNRSTSVNDYLEVWQTPDRERTLGHRSDRLRPHERAVKLAQGKGLSHAKKDAAPVKKGPAGKKAFRARGSQTGSTR